MAQVLLFLTLLELFFNQEFFQIKNAKSFTLRFGIITIILAINLIHWVNRFFNLTILIFVKLVVDFSNCSPGFN